MRKSPAGEGAALRQAGMRECRKAGTQKPNMIVRREYIAAGLEALIQAGMVSLWGEGGMPGKKVTVT